MVAHSYLALVFESSTPAAAGIPPRIESTLRSSRVRTRGVTGLDPPFSLAAEDPTPPTGVPFSLGDASGFERTIGLGLDETTFGLRLLLLDSEDRLNMPPMRLFNDREVED